MADNDNALTGRVDLNDPDLRARRRARIQTLLAKSPGAGAKKRPERRKAGAGLGDVLQNKALQRAFRVMTDTPDEGDGMVPDTPFTVAGVRKLVSTLQTRAEQEDQAGGKVASGLLKFLAPSDDSDPQAEGVSISKLQRLSKLAKRAGSL
jgi:hypothetical protein